MNASFLAKTALQRASSQPCIMHVCYNTAHRRLRSVVLPCSNYVLDIAVASRAHILVRSSLVGSSPVTRRKRSHTLTTIVLSLYITALIALAIQGNKPVFSLSFFFFSANPWSYVGYVYTDDNPHTLIKIYQCAFNDTFLLFLWFDASNKRPFVYLRRIRYCIAAIQFFGVDLLFYIIWV